MEEQMQALATGAPSPEDAGGFMDGDDWAQAQYEADKENGDLEPEGGRDDAEAGGAEPIPQRMVVRHNKQDVELSGNELAVAAQKGLDYDRIRESRDRYMEPLDRLAKQTGMSTDQFMKNLEGMVRQNVIESRKSEYLQMGANDFMADMMAKLAWENETMKNSSQAGARDEVRGRISRDIAAFEKKFPDVQDLPDEVIQDIRSGESPVVAYQQHLLRENEQKMRALEQNSKNRAGSAGAPYSIGTEQEDPFLAGFLSI